MLSAISNAGACGACGQLQSSCHSSVLTPAILMGGCGILRAGQPCGDMILILPPMLMIMRPTAEDLADSGTKTKVICQCSAVYHLTLTILGFCGVCGDAYDMPQPRPNEMGGEYGLGVIGATLASGQQLEVEVELTAYHQGYFQMRLCPHNRRDRPVAQTCLDTHLLSRVNGNHMYYPAKPEPGGRYKISYQLPSDLTCDLCVLQWRYVAGNSWGKCDNGTEGIGCGAQVDMTMFSSPIRLNIICISL